MSGLRARLCVCAENFGRVELIVRCHESDERMSVWTMASVEVLTIMNMWTKVGKSVTDCVDGYEIYYLSRCRRLDLTGLILISY